MDFYTVFTPAPKEGFETSGRSLTQQQFAEDCDINVLIKRHADPSAVIDLRNLTRSATRMPFWGDFSGVPDVRTAHDIFRASEAAFASLPADVRARFNNNPVELLAFTENPANREEVRKLFGDVPKAPDVVPEVAPVSADQKVPTE